MNVATKFRDAIKQFHRRAGAYGRDIDGLRIKIAELKEERQSVVDAPVAKQMAFEALNKLTEQMCSGQSDALTMVHKLTRPGKGTFLTFLDNDLRDRPKTEWALAQIVHSLL